MRLDDLLEADATTHPIDPDILAALNAFGFVTATYTLYQKQPAGDFVVAIMAERADGSSMSWFGSGKTPDEAQIDAIDACAKWILNQPVPFWPTP